MPLTIAVIFIAVALLGRNHAAAVQILGSPLVAIVMLLFILNTAYHMWIGLQEIIIDYVHDENGNVLTTTEQVASGNDPPGPGPVTTRTYDSFDRLVDGCAIRHIDGQRDHVRARSGQRAGGVIEGLAVEIEERDAPAVASQRSSDAEADTLRAARDDGDLGGRVVR